MNPAQTAYYMSSSINSTNMMMSGASGAGNTGVYWVILLAIAAVGILTASMISMK